MPVHTALGPIEPGDLGPTSMHEHVFFDASEVYTVGQLDTVDEPLTVAMLGDLHWNSVLNKQNLILEDPESIIDDLKLLRDHGGGAIVEATTLGLSRRIAELPAVSRASGIHIAVGCGFYRGPTHPDWVASSSVSDLAQYLLDELDSGLDGTGILPALIGELGTIDPVMDQEWAVLHAAAIASEETGAAILVHMDPTGSYQALSILEWLVGHGADPSRVILGHMDEILDLDNQRALLGEGAVIEYDLFGMELYYPGRGNYVTDFERMEAVAQLVSEGFAAQLVFACDVHMKMMYAANGGMGYQHLMKRIVPALEDRFDLSTEDIKQIMVHNPARLLSRP